MESVLETVPGVPVANKKEPKLSEATSWARSPCRSFRESSEALARPNSPALWVLLSATVQETFRHQALSTPRLVLCSTEGSWALEPKTKTTQNPREIGSPTHTHTYPV